jgi:hypothetical protein
VLTALADSMNSSDLSGFSVWYQWPRDVISNAPSTPGVYVFKLAGGESLCRLKGKSDIVYIGRTKKGKVRTGSVQRRLKQHLRTREDKIDIGYRIERVLKEIGRLEVAWRSFDADADAQSHEAELLERYDTDHIELPPLNRQESGKKVRQALKRLLGLPSDQAQQVVKSLAAKPKS